jgi:putative tryptophan/tyrosine transport system substrate-binding protein
MRVSRRRVVQGAGALGLGLLAGCGRLPGQAVPQSRVPRIGYLAAGSEPPYREAFVQGLDALGYADGRNIVIEWRVANDRPEQLAALAAELARLPADVIVVEGARAVRAAKEATSAIPIVIAQASDPVELGVAASLARPGGNITGLSHIGRQLAGKRLELLKETSPGANRVGVLWYQTQPGAEIGQWRELQDLDDLLGIQVQSLEMASPDGLETALAAADGERLDALVVVHAGPLLARRARIAEFAAQARLPAIYGAREYVEAGGLMAYSPKLADMVRRAATYVDRILKGASPSDLPIEQPMTFEFIINLRTAQALGLTIPQHVLLQATEVIQ